MPYVFPRWANGLPSVLLNCWILRLTECLPSHNKLCRSYNGNRTSHDDFIRWTHFPRCRPFVRGIHRSPVNSPLNGQWRGALMFSLICVWINGWVNNCEVGDLRRYRAHYDVTLMHCWREANTYQHWNTENSRYFNEIFVTGCTASCQMTIPMQPVKQISSNWRCQQVHTVITLWLCSKLFVLWMLLCECSVIYISKLIKFPTCR